MLNLLERKLEVYTDGSHKSGQGSWAFVITRGGQKLTERSGRVAGGGSNQMEFQAAIEALRMLHKKSNLTLYSDSKILIDAMNLGEIPKGFQSMVDTLQDLSAKHNIVWKWIKAHSGKEFNERCDELCILARFNKPKSPLSAAQPQARVTSAGQYPLSNL